LPIGLVSASKKETHPRCFLSSGAVLLSFSFVVEFFLFLAGYEQLVLPSVAAGSLISSSGLSWRF